jgi:hypothetical protein
VHRAYSRQDRCIGHIVDRIGVWCGSVGKPISNEAMIRKKIIKRIFGKKMLCLDTSCTTGLNTVGSTQYQLRIGRPAGKQNVRVISYEGNY